MWETLEELNVPLGFHEASGSRSRQTGDHLEPNFGLRRIFAQPMEQMLAMGSMVAGGVLVAKAVLLPVGLAFVVLRTREPQWIATERHPLVRLTLALAVALPIAVLVPRFGLLQPGVERAAVGLVALGITTAMVRRPAIFQVIGFLVAENGLYLGALSASGGLPVFVELGLVFDLVLIVSVAAVFSAKIHEELGTGDTTLLGGLRD